MIRNPTNLFGLQRWWSEAWWNHKILKIETSSKKAPYGPIKSNIIKICFTRSPYPFLNLNEIQTTPGPKKNESGTKTGLKNRTHLCPRFVKETINFITKTSPDTRGHFFAGASKKMKTLCAQKWKRDAYDTCWYCPIPWRDDRIRSTHVNNKVERATSRTASTDDNNVRNTYVHDMVELHPQTTW